VRRRPDGTEQQELAALMPSPIAIVGAGPAGLTAALALRRLGLEVTVFEQAEDFQRIGGGDRAT
jgi:2-polyprenyl-6-methoxyphenol hydroxylase-like FAD-dependent oxidoreductase